MIPNTLLLCKINHKWDVRVIDCSIDHLSFRIASLDEGIISVECAFYLEGDYQDYSITSFEVKEIAMNDYYQIIHLQINDEQYASYLKALMKEVNLYNKQKLMNQTEELIGLDEGEIAESCDAFYNQLFGSINADNDFNYLVKQSEFGICLDNPMDIKDYLENDIQFVIHKKLSFFGYHPLINMNVKYLYVGNQFCSLLAPSLAELERIINKAKEDCLQVVYMFSTMKEHEIEQARKTLDLLEKESIEIVVNDWGMMQLIKENNYHFECTLGILLNKHVKDTRLSFLKNIDYTHLSENGLNTMIYQEYLNSLNIKRFSYESCGYKMNILGNCDYYFPMFQMNTAGFCTMAAMCNKGNRALQEEVKECAHPCLSNAFLYPNNLKMIGKYNSLFGIDCKVLEDSSILLSLKEKKVRLICNL